MHVDYGPDDLTWEEIEKDSAWYEARLDLEEGETAWDPGKTGGVIIGPAAVTYLRAPSGAVTARVADDYGFRPGDEVEDREGDRSTVERILPDGRVHTDRGWTYAPDVLTRVDRQADAEAIGLAAAREAHRRMSEPVHSRVAVRLMIQTALLLREHTDLEDDLIVEETLNLHDMAIAAGERAARPSVEGP